MTSRSWCITINDENWTPASITDSSKIRNAVGQLEVAPSTGKKHWQCYFEFVDSIRAHGAQLLIGAPTAHCEKRQGTPRQAWDYCLKEDSRAPGDNMFTIGACPKESRKLDSEELANAVKNRTIPELLDEHPGAIFQNAKKIRDFDNLYQSYQRTTIKNIFCIYVHGAPGLGKTMGVVGMYNNNYHSLRDYAHGNIWFDGYHDQDVLLLDDVSSAHRPTLANMLHWCDRYEERVPVKNGMAIPSGGR